MAHDIVSFLSRTRSYTPSPHSQLTPSSSNQAHPRTESSSPYSDNEISSLYGKYRHSGHSLSEDDPHPHSHGHDAPPSAPVTNAHTLDPNKTSQWPGVLDELNWMLGQAIDSAQTSFGDPSDLQEPSPSVSRLSSNSQFSSRVQDGSSSGQPQNSPSSNTHVYGSSKPSKEDLSELATSSSQSNYSDSAEEESKEMSAQKPIQHTVTAQPGPGSTQNKPQRDDVDPSGDVNLLTSSTLQGYPVHDVKGLNKYEVDALAQDFSMIALSTEEFIESLQLDGAQTVYSEEDATSTSTNPSQARLVRRSPSFKLNNFITRKYKGLVSSRKSEPLHDPPPHNPIDPQTPTPMIPAALPSQDSTPMNSPLMKSPNKHISDAPSRRLIEEDQRKITQSPSSAARPLIARSPVVERSSSDINFLEQWQWLESQHPSRKNSLANQQNLIPSSNKPTINADMRSTRVPHSKEAYIRFLDDHFTSSNSAKDYFLKLALLSQRQQLYQQPCSRSNAGKSAKVPKSTSLLFQGVPTINAKEFKKVKTSKDRCRMYETKLQELLHHPTGLDLWVWLQSRGETRIASSVQEVKKFSIGSQVVDPHPRPLRMQVNHKAGNNQPLINFHRSTESTQRPHSNFPSFIRDVSMSSIASFLPRDGVVPHKAVQIKQTGEKNLVEVPRPEGLVHRANGVVVNSLMEVNNLPYPSLYPHSTNQNRGIPSRSLSSDPHPALSSPTKSIGINPNPGLPKKSILELSSKSTGGGFFSQLTRQNSSGARRRNEALNNTHNSPSRNNNLRVSPALISAPISTPRGPRPDTANLSKYPQTRQDTGDFANSSLSHLDPHQAQQQLSSLAASTSTTIPTQEMIQQHDETEELTSISSQSSPINQRMSFACDTHHRQPARRPAYHRHHNSASWTGAIGSFKAAHDHQLSPDEGVGMMNRKALKPDDCQQVDPPQRTDHPPTLANKTVSITQPTLDQHHQVELKSKIQELLDILPNADQNLLEKILIESNLNDIIAIVE